MPQCSSSLLLPIKSYASKNQSDTTYRFKKEIRNKLTSSRIGEPMEWHSGPAVPTWRGLPGSSVAPGEAHHVEGNDSLFRRRAPRYCRACRHSLVRCRPRWADDHPYPDTNGSANWITIRHPNADRDANSNTNRHTDSDAHRLAHPDAHWDAHTHFSFRHNLWCGEEVLGGRKRATGFLRRQRGRRSDLHL